MGLPETINLPRIPADCINIWHNEKTHRWYVCVLSPTDKPDIYKRIKKDFATFDEAIGYADGTFEEGE